VQVSRKVRWSKKKMPKRDNMKGEKRALQQREQGEANITETPMEIKREKSKALWGLQSTKRGHKRQ